MKLTIITVNLNNKDGLAKTIDSVLEQTFKDYEYIIIDGGSTDGSYDTIQKTKGLFPELIWVSEPDSGVFNAMNKGIMRSTGDYLLFLNSGDYLVNDSVLDIIFNVERTADILIGSARVSNHGKIVWRTFPKYDYTLKDFFHGTVAHQASFIKKSIFSDYGYYREDLRLMGDWEFFIRILIINHCSIEPLDILVSDYDAEGMSSDINNKDAISIEKDKVFTDLGLDKVIIDYKKADEWLLSHKPMLWAWSKTYLRKPIEILYRIASKRRN